MLHVLLPLQRVMNGAVDLEINELVHVIPFREGFHETVLMLVNAPHEIVGDTDTGPRRDGSRGCRRSIPACFSPLALPFQLVMAGLVPAISIVWARLAQGLVRAVRP